jgi:hypothetical protein
MFPPLHTNRRPQPRNHTIVFFDRQKGQTTHFTSVLDLELESSATTM